jgi:hypothetical protein
MGENFNLFKLLSSTKQMAVKTFFCKGTNGKDIFFFCKSANGSKISLTLATSLVTKRCQC